MVQDRAVFTLAD